MAHATNGNGPNGARKGSGKGKKGSKGAYASPAPVPVPLTDSSLLSNLGTANTDEDEFHLRREIQAAMPVEAKLRRMPKLVAAEWSVPTMVYTQLSVKGGVSLVPKEAIPAVMRAVGFTAAATAMLITTDPSSLGLGSYPHSQVECTIILNDNSEEKEVRVNRWCVQLGFTARVLRVAEGPKVTLSQTMLRMVCKQPEAFGWSAESRARNITEVLEKHGVSLVGISEIQVRSDISSTFLAHSNLAERILRLSGVDGTFFKVHANSQADFAMVDTHLVWLPDHTTLASGRQMLEGLSHLGFVCKRRVEPHRFAARFASQPDAQTFCKKHSLEDLTGYGRWK